MTLQELMMVVVVSDDKAQAERALLIMAELPPVMVRAEHYEVSSS